MLSEDIKTDRRKKWAKSTLNLLFTNKIHKLNLAAFIASQLQLMPTKILPRGY